MLNSKSRLILILVLALSLMWLTVAHAKAIRAAEAIWAHGELYDTVVTPATFNSPPAHSTDLIYTFMMSGLSGQRLVSEAAPGDPSYNGGRWSVQAATFTSDGIAALDTDNNSIIDVELTSVEQVIDAVANNYISIQPTSIYFECPMLPRRR